MEITYTVKRFESENTWVVYEDGVHRMTFTREDLAHMYADGMRKLNKEIQEAASKKADADDDEKKRKAMADFLAAKIPFAWDSLDRQIHHPHVFPDGRIADGDPSPRNLGYAALDLDARVKALELKVEIDAREIKELEQQIIDMQKAKPEHASSPFAREMCDLVGSATTMAAWISSAS